MVFHVSWMWRDFESSLNSRDIDSLLFYWQQIKQSSTLLFESNEYDEFEEVKKFKQKYSESEKKLKEVEEDLKADNTAKKYVQLAMRVKDPTDSHIRARFYSEALLQGELLSVKYNDLQTKYGGHLEQRTREDMKRLAETVAKLPNVREEFGKSEEYVQKFLKVVREDLHLLQVLFCPSFLPCPCQTVFQPCHALPGCPPACPANRPLLTHSLCLTHACTRCSLLFV